MDSKKIGERLRELRGIQTLDSVAKSVDITPSALSNYEQGIRVPRDEVKIRLAAYYKMSVESIFFDN